MLDENILDKLLFLKKSVKKHMNSLIMWPMWLNKKIILCINLHRYLQFSNLNLNI